MRVPEGIRVDYVCDILYRKRYCDGKVTTE